ncbi:inhibitor of growth protein 3-like [Acropora muricata]|uniref:inhibitor of growth protein 3-like n=1 Tax=Acropora millepora TaxID=45264 RepID=UPI0010FC9D16|nr:inhibitor of growth protein 3-like [Acropora millepora]
MLYLEDYVELIEQLPVELRDRFTEIREMDLQVQNRIDDLDIRVKQFFMNCRKAKPEWKDQQYKQIRDEYQKALEDADEKVNIATQTYDLVDRHLRKLDQELAKFKMELEADNAGITEVLEKRSLRLDEPANPSSPARNNHIHGSLPLGNKRKLELVNGDHLSIPGMRDYPYASIENYNQMSPSPKPVTPLSPSAGSLSYNVGEAGAASSAIAVAAAQAAMATLPMQPGRRGSGTLKAPYAAALGGTLNSLPTPPPPNSLNGLPSTSSSLGIPFESTSPNVNSVSIPVTPSDVRASVNVAPTATKQKKKNKGTAQVTAMASAQVAEQEAAVAAAAVPDWVFDPNEPRYCLCNQVSYGEMVGCDNPECPIEWFHYGCVGLTDAPKGKWFCPQCQNQIKQQRRGGRHK